MPNISTFQAGMPAISAHHALKTAVKTLEQAQQCAVLWFGDIYERRLFKELGYSSITMYAQKELGFSAARTSDYVKISQRLKQLPRVEAEVRSGKLGYTKAREVVKVADKRNEDQWLEVAHRQSRDDLAHQVKVAKREAKDLATGQGSLLPQGHQPAASPPARITFEMTAEQTARYEAIWERLQKMGGLPAEKTEALLEILECYLASDFTGGNVSNAEPVDSKGNDSPPGATQRNYVANQLPTQIHLHQCPDCEKATVSTRRGELTLSPKERDRLRCDAMISQPGKRNLRTIPPRTRRAVLSRDRYRCQRPGCTHNRFLEVHHIVPRHQGGSNVIENLITFCGACHRMVHQHRRLEISDQRSGNSELELE